MRTRTAFSWQCRVSKDFEKADIEIRLSSDMKRGSLWLNLYVKNNGDEDATVLFDNDPVNINITGSEFNINCIIYSNYGIDRVISENGVIERFNPNIFNCLDETIYSRMKPHIDFYFS